MAQTFYGIALGVHRAKAALGKDEALSVQALNHILKLADAGLTEMRALVFRQLFNSFCRFDRINLLL